MDMRANPVEHYIPDFPVKREMNRAYRPELNARLEAIHKRMEAGENLLRAAQIFEEVHWLVNYTDRLDDIERRLADLRESMADGGRKAVQLQGRQRLVRW